MYYECPGEHVILGRKDEGETNRLLRVKLDAYSPQVISLSLG